MAHQRQPSSGQFSTPQLPKRAALSVREWSRVSTRANTHLLPVSLGALSPVGELKRANTILNFSNMRVPFSKRTSSKKATSPLLSESPKGAKRHVRSLTDSLPRSLLQSAKWQLPAPDPPLETVENTVSRFAFKTRTGTVTYRPKSHNQDAYILAPNFARCRGQYLFAVCDGHGARGHEVSALLKETLPLCVAECLPSRGTIADAQERLSAGLREGMKRAAANVYRSKVDVTFSGSTCVAALLSGRALLCGNVGDSRAVLIRKDGKRWAAVALSTDHKPDIEAERVRILKSGGRISPFRQANGAPVGPMRVWRGTDDVPGLAMTRSIGDLVACQAGVTSEPELHFHQLEPSDKAVVLASDGLWEFMSNHEVASIVGEYWESGNLEGACTRLIRESVARWKYEDAVVDDITVILVHLQVSPATV